jgi:hypothetical protein
MAESTQRPLLASIAQYRRAATWLIAAFAAVGAALATGIQISNIGAVHDGRLIAAIASGLLALAGVVLAIWHVGRVLDVPDATLEDVRTNTALQRRIGDEPTFLGGMGHQSVGELADDYERTFVAYREAQRASWDKPDDELVAKELTRRADEFEALSQVDQFLRDVVKREKVAAAYRRAQVWVVVGAVFAFAGLILFAYAANPPKPTPNQPQLVEYENGRTGPTGPTGPKGPPGRPGRDSVAHCPGGTPSDPC